MACAKCECMIPSSSCCSEHMEKQHEKRGDRQNPEPKTGLHIMEALGVQLDVQRRLHERLQIQRSLQVRIEEQVKRLQKMFEDQLKASPNNLVRSPEVDRGGVDVVSPSKTKQDEAVSVIGDDDVQLIILRQQQL